MGGRKNKKKGKWRTTVVDGINKGRGSIKEKEEESIGIERGGSAWSDHMSWTYYNTIEEIY